MRPYNPALKLNARRLRSQMTDAEQLLWRHLRRQQIGGVTFYRQKPLLSFIVDFYCPKARLVIELDGGQHFEPAAAAKDSARDEALASLGLVVLRFDNHQVLTMLDRCCLLSILRWPCGWKSPLPPFDKGGRWRCLR